MELHCEGITTTNGDEKKNELNPSATEFRPKRTAGEIAKWRFETLSLWKVMMTFDNAYQIGGAHVANVNIVIFEMYIDTPALKYSS